MQQLLDKKSVDYYNKLFEDVQGEPDRRQKLDEAVTTEDTLIDDGLFNDNTNKIFLTLLKK